MQSIYLIYDTVAQAFIGGLMIHRHDAPVIRHFYDLLANRDSIPAKHPEDYELRAVAHIDDEGGIQSTPIRVVTTGSVWAASLNKDLEQ